MKSPEVSICIPTYNSAKFLPDAISSVMQQGLNDFELLIIDNASTDGTEILIQSLKNQLIRYIRNPVNLGSQENFNSCLREARGSYIKFLCSDDVLMEGVLPKQIEILKTCKDVSLVTCDMVITDAELRETDRYRFIQGKHSGSFVIACTLTSLNNYIGGPSNFLFRRDDALGITFDFRYRWISDLKFAVELLKRGSYFNINEFGYLYRRHEATDTNVNCPPEIRSAEFFRLVDEFDSWNVLNLTQAILSDKGAGLSQLKRNWWHACNPKSVAQALLAATGILQYRRSRRALSANSDPH